MVVALVQMRRDRERMRSRLSSFPGRLRLLAITGSFPVCVPEHGLSHQASPQGHAHTPAIQYPPPRTHRLPQSPRCRESPGPGPPRRALKRFVGYVMANGLLSSWRNTTCDPSAPLLSGFEASLGQLLPAQGPTAMPSQD